MTFPAFYVDVPYTRDEDAVREVAVPAAPVRRFPGRPHRTPAG